MLKWKKGKKRKRKLPCGTSVGWFTTQPAVVNNIVIMLFTTGETLAWKDSLVLFCNFQSAVCSNLVTPDPNALAFTMLHTHKHKDLSFFLRHNPGFYIQILVPEVKTSRAFKKRFKSVNPMKSWAVCLCNVSVTLKLKHTSYHCASASYFVTYKAVHTFVVTCAASFLHKQTIPFHRAFLWSAAGFFV